MFLKSIYDINYLSTSLSDTIDLFLNTLKYTKVVETQDTVLKALGRILIHSNQVSRLSFALKYSI